MSYSSFEHTADLGLRVEAKDLDELLLESARGLTAALVGRPDQVKGSVRREITVEGTANAPDYLLVDWLGELLFLFNVEELVCARFELERNGSGGLTATVWGERFDATRHGPGQELKAITYHGLRVEQRAGEGDDGGWIAELVIDL